MTQIDEDLVALPEDEQVVRGQELIALLRTEELQPSTSAVASKSMDNNNTGHVDWNVIVKQTFIDVVLPACRGARRRTVSEPVLACFEKTALPWKSISSSVLHDIGDASTDDSSSGDVLEGECLGTRVRNDTCWSAQGEEAPDTSAMAYNYWWMPIGYPTDAPTTSTGLTQGGMGFNGAAFVPMQWMDPSMASGQCHSVAAADSEEWRTTVMIRNMPNNYTRDMLLELVDSMGFAGSYDFAYLPIDFQSQAGLGYAFLNFVSVADALRCFSDFDGFSNWKVPSEKVCTVTWSSPTQGLEAHIDRYRNSPVMHYSLTEDWKPILLQQGRRVPFPLPTKAIKTPKDHQLPSGKNACA